MLFRSKIKFRCIHERIQVIYLGRSTETLTVMLSVDSRIMVVFYFPLFASLHLNFYNAHIFSSLVMAKFFS